MTALLAVTALLFGLTACGKPSETPLEYLDGVFENAFPSAEATILSEPVLAELIFNGTEDTDLFAPGLALDLKYYFSAQGSAYLMNGSYAGIDADLSLYSKTFAQTNAIAIGSKCLLGDTVLGTDLSKIKENLASSPFADPESELYLGEELLAEIVATFNTAPDTQWLDLQADFEAVLAKYLDLLKDGLTEYDCATMTDGQHGGKTVTVTLTEESAEKLIRLFYGTAKDDKALRGFLEDYVRYAYGSMLSEYEAEEEDENIGNPTAADILAQYGIEGIIDNDNEDSIGDMMAEYDAFFADEAQLNELIDELKKTDLPLTFTVDTDGDDKPVAASITFDATLDGEYGKIALLYDGSEANEQRFTLDLDIPTEEDEEPLPFETLSFVLKTEEDANSLKKTVSLEMTSGMKVTMELYSLTYRKTDGAYTLNLGRGLLGGQPISLSGVYTASEDGLSLTVTKVDVPMAAEAVGKTSFAVGIRLAVKTPESVPAFPAYTEILTMTEEEIVALESTVLESPLGQLLASLGDGFAGDAEPDEP